MEGCCEGKCLAQLPALSKFLIKDTFFPSLQGPGPVLKPEVPLERSLMTVLFTNWAHILRLDTLLKKLQCVIISHEDRNLISLIKQRQNL